MDVPPPALRRVGVREILDALPLARRAVLAAMNTDACLGYSVPERPGSQLASNSFGASRSVIGRFRGQASNRHTGAKREWAQRAKVAHSPCRTTLTRAALSSTFVLGSLDVSKAQRMQMWMELEPLGRT